MYIVNGLRKLQVGEFVHRLESVTRFFGYKYDDFGESNMYRVSPLKV